MVTLPAGRGVAHELPNVVLCSGRHCRFFFQQIWIGRNECLILDAVRESSSYSRCGTVVDSRFGKYLLQLEVDFPKVARAARYATLSIRQGC